MISPRSRTIGALGIVQILAWGSTFYLLAPLSSAIAADTGWRPGLLAAGVSLALMISGLGAPTVGRWIEARGGRGAIAMGMACLSMGLALLGIAQAPWAWLLGWAVIGAGMSMGLYDAAFSTLGQLFRGEARSAITQLTLWGGFASTLCWPLTAWAESQIGWRATCLAYAAVHLCLTLPLCLTMIPRPAPAPARDSTAPAPRPATWISARDPRFVCIAAAGVSMSMLNTVWSIHMVTLLTAQGYAVAAAIALGTLIGPAQVGARLIEMMGRGRHHPIWTMGVATTLVFAGMAALSLGVTAGLAIVAYAAGNGLWSITRGALPLAVFGPDGFAVTMGRLARPMQLSGAAAPSVGAAMIAWLGPEGVMIALPLCAAIPCLAALILARRITRDRLRAVA